MASLTETARRTSIGETTAEAVLEFTLATIEQYPMQLNAFTMLLDEQALRQARALDDQRSSGAPVGKLHGVPVVVKDNMDVAGVPTTCGSKTWTQRVPRSDADVVASLKAAGAVVVGKTNMDEFAWGGTGLNPSFGNVVNPRCPEVFAAGSSAGTAVAVAAGFVSGGLGSDTGGSIRLPASVNGVVGLRPTVGSVCAQGVVPLSQTLDSVGPIANTVEDCALLYSVIAGKAVETDENDLTVGITDWFFENLHPEVEAMLRTALDQLQEHGVEVITLSADWLLEYFEPWLTIHLVEPAQYFYDLRRANPEAFSPMVTELLQAGEDIPEREYLAALRERDSYVRRCAQLFTEVDALVSPTLPFPAIAPGAENVELPQGTTPLFEALPRFTGVASMAGLPALTLPVAVTTEGIPMGVQFIGASGAEGALFALGHLIEQSNRLERAHGG